MPRKPITRLPVAPSPDPSIRHIPLTRGYYAIVDPEDYEFLMQWKWMVTTCNGGGNFYACRRRKVSEKHLPCSAIIMMHRAIVGFGRDFQVDHINGDSLDNRRTNLRKANHSQNMHNREARGLSPYVGVSHNGTRQRGNKHWRASVSLNGKLYRSKTFATQEEAARERDAMAARLQGEFARLNFPEEREVAVNVAGEPYGT